jgi:hypothetical protein
MEIRIPYRKVGILSFELHYMRFQDSLRLPESQRKKSENNLCIRDIYCEEGTRSSMVLQHRLNMELDLQS